MSEADPKWMKVTEPKLTPSPTQVAEQLVPPIHHGLAADIDAAVVSHLTEEEYENVRSVIVRYVVLALTQQTQAVWAEAADMVDTLSKHAMWWKVADEFRRRAGGGAAFLGLCSSSAWVRSKISDWVG